MKKRRIALCSICASALIAGVCGAFVVGTFARADAHVNPSNYSIVLNKQNAPTKIVSGHAVTHPDPYHSSTFTYDNAAAFDDGHIILNTSGTIEKDCSFGLDKIIIKANKDLRIQTAFTAGSYVSTYVAPASTTGSEIYVCGNYIKIVADEATEITEIEYCYGCSHSSESKGHTMVDSDKITIPEAEGRYCVDSGEYKEHRCSHCHWGTTNYVFYAIDDKVSIGGTSKKNTVEYCVGKEGSGSDMVVDYIVGCQKATTAHLKFWMSRNSQGDKATDAWVTTINGSRVTSDARAPAMYYPECFQTYDVLDIGDVSLKAGLNKIHMVYADAKGWEISNLRAIFLATNEPLSLVEELDPQTIKACDDSVVTNGKKNYDEDCIGAYYVSPTDCTLTMDFTINFEFPVTTTMSYTVSKIEQPLNMFSVYETKINGVAQTTTAVMPTAGTIWSTYHKINVGQFNFNAGVNVIHIEYNWNSTNDHGCNTSNFRQLSLENFL